MTINYNIFKTDAKIDGKCFKVIFKATKCKDYDARILACRTEANEFGRWQGLELTAQSGIYRSQDTEVNIPYCEDRYIELELDINRNEGKTTYIQSWLDGIPASYARYDDSDNFVLPDK